jgi:hypothetical protein
VTLGKNTKANVKSKAWSETMTSNSWAGEAQKRADDPSNAELLSRVKRGERNDPATTKYNVPLAYGGPIALLGVANLNVEGGVESFVRALQGMGPRRAEERCTVEQLKLAQEFGRALSMAVTEGRDSPLWKRMGDALDTLRGKQMGRRGVVKILGDLLSRKRATDHLLKTRPDYAGPPEMTLEYGIDNTRAALATIDPAFAKVTSAKLKELLDRPRLGAVGIAVELSIAYGIFGDKLKDSETGRKLAQQKRRIRGLYDEARRVGRTESQSTT